MFNICVTEEKRDSGIQRVNKQQLQNKLVIEFEYKIINLLFHGANCKQKKNYTTLLLEEANRIGATNNYDNKEIQNYIRKYR